MPRTSLYRLSLALMLAAAMLLPSLPVAASQTRQATHKSPTPVANVSPLSWLPEVLIHLWEQAGCVLDPHGACTSTPSTDPHLDAGCGADPHGICADSAAIPAPQLDAGCVADPHGGCTVNP
jgi:hypothetical protein